MAARSATTSTARRRAPTHSAAAAADANAEAGPSRLPPLTERKLANHVNRLREVPNFTGFDALLSSAADDWMDAMLQQAVNVRQTWSIEYEANQSSGMHAALAGEMLKTPSRKKAQAAHLKTKATRTASKQMDKHAPEPFPEPDDKENTPAEILLSPRANTAATAVRSTRSRAEEEPPKLPNPFQTKLLQTKARTASRSTPKESIQSIEPKAASPTPPQPKQPSPTTQTPHAQPATSTPRQPPPRALPKPLQQLTVGEDSMEVESTLAELSTFDNEPPRASTPNGSRSQSTSKRISVQHLTEIADPRVYSSDVEDDQDDPDIHDQDDPDDDAQDKTEHMPPEELPDDNDATKHATSVRTDDTTTQPKSDAQQKEADPEEENEAQPLASSMSASSLSSPPPPSSSADVANDDDQTQAQAPVSPPPVQRMKRTLNSFGGTKKSLGYTLQAHAASTPGNAPGFKSSFLNKSLRKASAAAKDVEDDPSSPRNPQDSFDLSQPTRANTQANAAAVVAPHKATESKPSQPNRSAGIKRKSDEPDDVARAIASKQAKSNETARLSKQTNTRPELSRASSQQSDTASQAHGQNVPPLSRPPSSNLLRSRLESARLQRSATSATVGLGLSTKTLPSPMLNRYQFSPPAPSTPEADPGVGLQSLLSPPGRKGGNVSELLDRWEAKSTNGSAQNSPGKSLAKKSTSPSKLPIPVSSTPTGSPGPKALCKGAVAQPGEANVVASEADKPVETVPEETSSQEEDVAANESAVTAKEDIQDNAGSQSANVSTDKRQSLDDLDENELSAQSEEEDADDEDGEDAEEHDDQKQSTKITRPLSRGQSQDSQKIPTASANAQSRERSVSGGEFFSGDESEGSAEARAPQASDENAAESKQKPARPETTGINSMPAIQAASGVPWSSRLKNMFMASGGGGVGMGPAPGSGFQPNKNRIATGSSTASTASGVSSAASSRVVTASEQSAEQKQPQPQPATAARPAVVETGKLTSLAAQKAKVQEAQEKERKRRAAEEDDKTATQRQEDKTGPQRPPTAQSNRNAGMNSTATSASSAAASSRARVVSQFGQASGSNAKLKAPAPKTATVGGQSVMTSTGKKRRLTQENEDKTGPIAAQPPTKPVPQASKVGSSNSTMTKTMSKTGGAAGQTRPVTASNTWAQKSVASSANVSKQAIHAKTVVAQSNSRTVGAQGGFGAAQRPGLPSQPSMTNFSSANPFQQARVPGTPAANAAKTVRGPTPLQHPRVASIASPNIDDDNMSLPSIASEYSDSEDEETQARRARAAPWTKGQALTSALQNQATMDTDAIFGVPRGTVDLNVLMPPRDAEAHKRIFRPRSSSANWSGPDGLAQWEIERYNERMNIASSSSNGNGSGKQKQ